MKMPKLSHRQPALCSLLDGGVQQRRSKLSGPCSDRGACNRLDGASRPVAYFRINHGSERLLCFGISKLSARARRQRLLTVREIENAIVLLKRGAQKATEFMCPQQRSKIEFALLFNLGAARRGRGENGVFNLNPWHNRQ